MLYEVITVVELKSEPKRDVGATKYVEFLNGEKARSIRNNFV